MSNNPEEDRIKKFLNKKQDDNILKTPLTQEEKQQFIFRNLFTQQPQEHQLTNSQKQKIKFNFYDKFNRYYKGIFGRGLNSFAKESFPFIAFIVFSSYICYKMETEYDKMVRSVFKVKTIKQELVEKEDEYIRSVLQQNQYENNTQIKEEKLKKNHFYRFEKFEEDEDEDEQGFNTKEDFLEALRRDYNKGMEIPEEYRREVFLYADQNQKRLKYNSDKEFGSDEEQEDEEQNYQKELINLSELEKLRNRSNSK